MSPSDKRWRPESTSTQADLVALAKDKLAMPVARPAELDRLIAVLHGGEQVVTLCDALFSSRHQEWRGLVVLTDERFMCVDTRSQHLPLVEFGLATISSVEARAPVGSGDARRGRLTMLADGVETELSRVRPWERAAEIARHVALEIAARRAMSAEHPSTPEKLDRDSDA
jgi:hypothetical protein